MVRRESACRSPRALVDGRLSMQIPSCAMVMAAGLGTRMRPLTLDRPKPLVAVAGAPLIDHVLDRLAAAGVTRAIVNVHHFADMLEAHLRARQGGCAIVISDERAALLETGGGLVHALPLIDADPFIQVNSDNVWTDGATETFARLARHWDDARMDALLLLVPLASANGHAGRGDFDLEADGRITRRSADSAQPLVWTGIQMLSKRLIADAPMPSFSTNVFWDRAIRAGRAFGVEHDGAWFDVGTPQSIPLTEAALAAARLTHG